MSQFLDKYSGYLAGVMQWDDLDRLWEVIRKQDKTWYLYAVGESVPEQPAGKERLHQFIDSINSLLHDEHAEDYCGIVYSDDVESPSLVKIYDPNNLGVVCGYSENPPLPGWVMSHDRPVDLPQAFPPPANRKKWWRKLFPAG